MFCCCYSVIVGVLLMNKIKFKNNIIMVKSKKGQQLAESKIEFANKELSDCLLKMECKKKRSSFVVFLYSERFITLKDYLLTPLNKKTFAVLLSNILDNLKVLKGKFYDYHNILLDINFVMVNPVTRKVCFAYIPIEPFDSGYSLNKFLLSIADEATFEQYEDTSYVSEYIRILNSNKNFSPFDLEEFVHILRSSFHVIKVTQINCPDCNAIISSDRSYCTQCGCNLHNRKDVFSKGIYDFSDNSKTIQPTCEIKNGIILRRKITGEKTEVNKQEFVIGRSNECCDYVISDPSISSKHACIICKPSGSFVVDNNSTNFTFINNRRVLPGIEEELSDGCEIRFANIAFEVSIK